MRRPSKIVEDLVSKIDALSGKCYTKSQESEQCRRIRDVPKEALLYNADSFLTGIAKGLEYFVAKPLYHAENFVAGKKPSPGWVFSR